jgi:hypothetical protein
MVKSVEGEDASRIFWNSERTRYYPNVVRFEETTYVCADGIDVKYAIGRWLAQAEWIPENGEILDLGAGPSSEWIFPDAVERDLVTALDFSELQLSRSTANSRHLGDLKKPKDFPVNWKDKFSLIASIESMRFLSETQRINLYRHCYDLLNVNGRLLIIEGVRSSEQYAREMGEISELIPDREAQILEGSASYSFLDFGTVALPFTSFSRFEKVAGPFNFVTGIK